MKLSLPRLTYYKAHLYRHVIFLTIVNLAHVIHSEESRQRTCVCIMHVWRITNLGWADPRRELYRVVTNRCTRMTIVWKIVSWRRTFIQTLIGQFPSPTVLQERGYWKNFAVMTPIKRLGTSKRKRLLFARQIALIFAFFSVLIVSLLFIFAFRYVPFLTWKINKLWLTGAGN